MEYFSRRLRKNVKGYTFDIFQKNGMIYQPSLSLKNL